MKQDYIENRDGQNQQSKEFNNPPQQACLKLSVQSKNLFKRKIIFLKNNIFKIITLLILFWAIVLQIQICIAQQTMDKKQSLQKENYLDITQKNDKAYQKSRDIEMEYMNYNKVNQSEQKINSFESELQQISQKVDNANDFITKSYSFQVQEELQFTIKAQQNMMDFYPKSLSISLQKKSFVTLQLDTQILSKTSGFMFTFAKDQKLIREYISYNLPVSYKQIYKLDTYQRIQNAQDIVLESGDHLFYIAYQPFEYNTNQIEYSLKLLQFTIQVQELEN